MNHILHRWVFALKPASWPKLLVPTWFGQVLGAMITGELRLDALLWGFAFTMSGLGYIVLINDWGDQKVDKIKRQMFPDTSSPKAIPDLLLSPTAVGRAGLIFGILSLIVCVGTTYALQRPKALWLGTGSIAIFAMYTLPPFRLNYRGGGELLEMVGVGVLLPVYQIYLQSGRLHDLAWSWIVGFCCLCLASAIASGLSDEQSDQAGGKHTFVSTWGNRCARNLTELLVLCGGAVWLAMTWLQPSTAPLWVVFPTVATLLGHFAAMHRVSSHAVTNAFAKQNAYKRYLHGAIWSSTMLGVSLLWFRLVFS